VTRISSVHIADVGARRALGLLRRAPTAPGLLSADVALAAPLASGIIPRPQLGRIALVAFWEDGEALERFEAEHPVAEQLAGGWRAALEPLRAHGSWPGLASDVAKGRIVDHDGPAAVLTLGRLRVRRAPAFFRASAKAERAVVAAPGLRWATGMARPPFVATCSLWGSTSALSSYAYGDADPRHNDAIAVDRAGPFHTQSAFIRFRVLRSSGGLDGTNPLPPAEVPVAVEP